MKSQKRNIHEERYAAKKEWEYWAHQIGSAEFCANKERGQEILKNERRAYSELKRIENEIYEGAR